MSVAPVKGAFGGNSPKFVYARPQNFVESKKFFIKIHNINKKFAPLKNCFLPQTLRSVYGPVYLKQTYEAMYVKTNVQLPTNYVQR